MTPPATYEALASAVNHILLGPELTNTQIVEALEAAKRHAVGVATVRPSDVESAARVLAGSAVVPAAVAGYPYGFQSTGVKLYEVRDLLRRGAKEVAAVIAVARLLSREFQHVQTELNQMVEVCHGEGARLIVILDLPRLDRELKIIASTCCERAEVDGVAALGEFTGDDLALLEKHLPDEATIEVAASTADDALALLAQGATRLATASPAAILDDWKRRTAAPTE
jgi:deoxyribose-phosphate aldolase